MNRIALKTLVVAAVAGTSFAASAADANTPAHGGKLRAEVASGQLTKSQARELHADHKALRAKHRAMVQSNTGAAVK